MFLKPIWGICNTLQNQSLIQIGNVLSAMVYVRNEYSNKTSPHILIHILRRWLALAF